MVAERNRSWRWWRVTLSLLLLGMILMRLVWMQLRTYRATVDPRAYLSLQVYEDLLPSGTINLGQIPPGLKAQRSENPPPLEWFTSPLLRSLHTWVGSGENLNERFFVRNQQSLLMVIVFFLVLMARMMTSSWTCALVVGAVLMSRGRLLTMVGQISVDIPVMTIIAAFFATMTHVVRTGSWLSLGAAMVMVVFGTQLDGSLAGLALAMPMMLFGGYVVHLSPIRGLGRKLRRYKRHLLPIFLIRKLRARRESAITLLRLSRELKNFIGVVPTGVNSSPARHRDRRVNYRGGALLRTLRVPFLLWCFAQKRWTSMVFLWVGSAVFALTLLLVLKSAFANLEPLNWVSEGWVFERANFTTWQLSGISIPNVGPLLDAGPVGTATDTVNLTGLSGWVLHWMKNQFGIMDLHLVLSFLVLALCLGQSPSGGFPGFGEVCWIVVFGILGIGVVALVGDAFDQGGLSMLKRQWPTTAELRWRPRMVLEWFEPVFLSLGIAGIYNLLRATDRPLARSVGRSVGELRQAGSSHVAEHPSNKEMS